MQFYIPHFYDFPFGLKEIDFGKQTANCKLPSSCFIMFGLKAPLHERIFIGKVCLFLERLQIAAQFHSLKTP